MSGVDFERLDSLDGWVAVKSNLFEEREAFRLGFIVQWSVIESKFAVTCHNRTLQRQKRRDELANGAAEISWAGLFSVNDLKNLHRHFTRVGDALSPYFPDLRDFEEGNIWDLIFFNRAAGPEEQEKDLETPCRQLEKYLSTAVDVCGRKIVLDTLFGQDERDVEEYFENLQEFKRKTMQEEVAIKRILPFYHFFQILQQHNRADRLVILLKIYEEEDEAYKELVTVATHFYQYLLQPFRDMRELAMLYKMEILKSLECEELGPKRIAALEKEAEEWRKRAEDAVSSIQDITVSYFVETSKALAGMSYSMEEDKKRFGQASWASASPRLERLKFLLAKETLQHMRAKEMCLNRKKEEIREKMGNLADQKGDILAVDQLELQYYEAQLELYDIKFETLRNEELLLVAQIDTVRRQIKELREEVVYYDTCEDPEELHSIIQTSGHQECSPSIKNLSRRLQQLETKRGTICARRAYLRNKKVCMQIRALRFGGLITETCQMLVLLPSPRHRPRAPRRRRRSSSLNRKTSRCRSSCQLDLALCRLTRARPPPLPHHPPPPPPPPPPPLPPISSDLQMPLDAPKPLSAKEAAKNSLNQNIGNSSMDEVLASLQRGQIQLRKVQLPAPKPPSRDSVNVRESILSAIRQGVKLKKVQMQDPAAPPPESQDTELERSIKAAMQRMKRVSSDSDEEDESDDHGDTQSAEWDS
uniref:WH2 domain-containing protein n=1 Tax=Denticeps clupeoides TaxID=299321 RepID=A0AAY4DBP3_9TELE